MDDLHITGNQYLFTLTIYFIGYVRPSVRPSVDAAPLPPVVQVRIGRGSHERVVSE